MSFFNTMKKIFTIGLMVVLLQQVAFAGPIIWKSKVIERQDGAIIYKKINEEGAYERPTWGRHDGEVIFTLSKGGYESAYSNLYFLDVKTSAIDPITLERNRRLETNNGFLWSEEGLYFTEIRNDYAMLRRLVSTEKEMGETYEIADSVLFPRWADIGNPSLSPDGEWLVYDAYSSEKRVDGSKVRQIYKMNRITGEVVQITSDSNEKRRPKWSPEGSLILYEQYDHQFREWSLYTVDFLGKHHRRFTLAMGDECYGSFSPDGQWVVYTATEAPDIVGEALEKNKLYIQSIYGGNVYALTQGEFYDTMPSWSPNGDRILFQVSYQAPGEGVPVWVGLIEVPELFLE